MSKRFWSDSSAIVIAFACVAFGCASAASTCQSAAETMNTTCPAGCNAAGVTATNTVQFCGEKSGKYCVGTFDIKNCKADGYTNPAPCPGVPTPTARTYSSSTVGNGNCATVGMVPTNPDFYVAY